jgi:hypothetical protein
MSRAHNVSNGLPFSGAGAARLVTAELQRLWQEGITSGPGRFTSIGQIKKDARRRVRIARGEQQTPSSS